jgi:hypothetical protein
MKKSERNKLHMYRRVREVCNAHEESWNGVPAFEEAFTVFSEKVALVGELGVSQSHITTGVKHRRETQLEAATESVMQCAAALRSFGVATGNVQLVDLVDIRRSDITQTTLNGAIVRIGGIVQEVEKYTAELEDYGITQEKRELLTTRYEVLRAEIDAPRIAIASRRTVTNRISRLVREIDKLIDDHLDGLVSVIRTEAPEFYELYLSARVVVNTATRHRKPENPSGDKSGEPDDGGSLY